MKKVLMTFLVLALHSTSSAADAQFVTVGADEVISLMTGKEKAVLIDVRSVEEYRAGHIPGAVHIPADRITAEKGRLPKNKAARLIFYCRGVG